MAHKQLDEFYQKKSDEKEQGRRFRDEYNDLVKRNIQRDIVKEENYRNVTPEHCQCISSRVVLQDDRRPSETARRSTQPERSQ